ncbi:MAG: AAA family ATPase [Bryobacterales bacterium]|nr:AAA family ATPase [Bryobacterales bacterium]
MSRPARFSALLIAPNRSLGGQLLARTGEDLDLAVTHQLDSYPSPEALAALVDSSKPDLVFVDLATDIEAACGLIRTLAAHHPDIYVVGLDQRKDSETVMKVLREGATEFLHSPFEPAELRGALARIDRLRRSSGSARATSGTVIAFTSAKPGAGATTLATQTALALRALTGQRILLLDFNFEGGLVGAGIAPAPRYSVIDALDQAHSLDVTKWSMLTEYTGHIDLLAAPQDPYEGEVEPETIHALLASARLAYDWIVVDLPAVFQLRSQVVLFEADQGFVVTTTELPSLHLARRASAWLAQYGFGKERCRLLVNRAAFSASLDRKVVDDVLNCPAYATLPNDYRTLHDLRRFGETPGRDTELGASLHRFAARLAGSRDTGSPAPSQALGLRPAMAR